MSATAILANFVGAYPKRGFVRPADSVWNVIGADGPNNPTGAVYLALDAMLSEAPEYEATPTESPVEDASTITDHVQLKPDKLTIQGIVTDTPIGVRAVQNLFSQPVAGVAQALGLINSPSAVAHNWLLTLRNNRIPFDFVGGLGTYKTMVLTSYKPVRNAQNGDALHFTATMQKVIVVQTQTLSIFHSPVKKSKGTQVLGITTPQLNEPINNMGEFLKGGIRNPATTNTAGVLLGVVPK